MPTLDYVDLERLTPLPEEKREIVDKLNANPQVKDTISRYQDALQFSARRLAEEFSIPVVEAQLPGNLAGFLNPINGQKNWEIVINNRISEQQKRWAIIHELCHWVLDMDCGKIETLKKRLLPLFLGSSGDTYSQFEVVVKDRWVRFGKTHYRVKVEYDPFIQLEEASVRRSERMANWLAGYILMPEKTLRQLTKSYPTAKELAEKYNVPVSVAGTQMAFSLNHRLKRRSMPEAA